MSAEIAANVARVREQIATACARVGRSPDSVTLVAVSKKKPAADIVSAAAAGVTHFGESRIEETEIKRPAVMAQVNAPLRWHMIGPVAPRRARYVPRLFDLLESVDSVALAERLSELTVAGGLPPFPVLVEINITGEESKAGLAAVGWRDDESAFQAVADAMRAIIALPGLDVRGLMTIAPYLDDMEATRPTFAGLRRLRDALQDALGVALPELSMGMTNDYPVAIEEGSTIIRVGRAIFGERN